MNTKQMKRLGADHFKRGGTLGPCSELMLLDASIHSKARELFPDASGTDIRPFRFYNQMRGAFNKGWEDAFVEEFV